MPIVQRELLVSSRKRLTFWSRIGAALAGFLAVFFIVGAEPDAMTVGALGAKLFHWLANAAFWLCLFGGAVLTADCLSVEKREGTLGLLFLTDLKGHDVVLGKLVARSLTAVFCLIAIVPMLAVPILLGGVTGGDFWRVTLLLLNTLFVSLCLGMVVSVFSHESRNATAVAVFAVVLWLLLPMIASSLLPVRGRGFVSVFSPSVPWSHAFSAMPGRRFGLFAIA
jgi:ABC-type transport system involved in cytochrome c biogenesis permease component